MRVLIAADLVSAALPEGPAELTAGDVTFALARGWQASRADDELVLHPLSDGDRGLIGAASSALGGQWRDAPGTDALGRATVHRWWQVGRTAYLEARDALGSGSDDPPAPAAALALRGSSEGLGHLLVAVLSHDVSAIVIGIGPTATHDAGLGLLRVLGGDRSGDRAAGQRARDVAALVRAARDRLGGVDVLIASSSDLPLVGLHGAGAALARYPGIDAAAAQERERALSASIGEVEAGASPAPSLLTGAAPVRLARRPGGGAGGGVAFALEATGARLRSGAQAVAALTDLAGRMATVDVALTAGSVLDGAAIAEGVPAVVGRHALAHMTPVVAVGAEILLSRRELSGTGIVAMYPLWDPIHRGDPAGVGGPAVASDARGDGGPALAAALSQRASRIARTWSR